jgi:hypothetical protein
VNPLDGCYLKLERSQQHLTGLYEAAKRFFEADGGFFFSFKGQSNAQRSKYVFTVDEVPALPTLEWGIIVGDAVHSLRSALDQLVYAVADDPTDVCAFPIYNTEKEWVINSPRLLWSVPEQLQTFIKTAQPYHLGEQAGTHPFAMLRLLDNLDKHRTIPTTALVPMSARIDITGTVGIASYEQLRIRQRTPLEHGAKFAEIRFKPDDSGLEPHVDMNSHFDFEVSFGRGSIPSPLYLKPIVQTFNDTLGSWVFGFIRKASEIIEPGVERPDNLSIHGLPPPE